MDYKDDFDMFLVAGHKYRMLLMTGETIEGTLTDPDGIFNTFHIKVGKKVRQYYYWDVDGAEEI